MTKRLAATALLLALAGCAAPSDPIPQDTTTAPAAKAKPAAAKPKVSSCDQAREAFLTGTPADVTRALKRLKADKTADGTAREYAGYWLGRDAGDPKMRELDQSLIVSSCS